MLMSEFIERTGFEPTTDEYSRIEEAYYNFDGDKDAFCKAFLENGGEKKINRSRISYIRELESEAMESDKAHKAEVGKLQAQIENLQKKLDRELEWKPVDGREGLGTWMSQADYETLFRICTSHTDYDGVLSDEDAKKMIFEQFGFAPEMVRIMSSVETFEVNKYEQVRGLSKYERRPLYEATDWNYIRFDCQGFMWEIVNGDLKPYWNFGGAWQD